MEPLRYACCFCGDEIAPSKVDPCAVLVIGNWQSPVIEEQAEQQFFCHLACFKRAIRSNVPVGIEEILADIPESSPSAG